jgi:hypothetical protein
MALTKATYSMIGGAAVNALDYGAFLQTNRELYFPAMLQLMDQLPKFMLASGLPKEP